MNKLYKVQGWLTNKSFTIDVIGYDIEKETEKIIQFRPNGKMDKEKHFNKDKLNKVISSSPNTATSDIEFHVYCLEADILRNKEVVKQRVISTLTVLQDAINDKKKALLSSLG